MPASINSLNVIMALINSELDEQSRDFSTKQLAWRVVYLLVLCFDGFGFLFFFHFAKNMNFSSLVIYGTNGSLENF